MGKEKHKADLLIVKIYVAVFLTSLIFLILTLKTTPFAGVFVVILTLPWSIISTLLFDYLGIMDSIPTLIKIIVSILEASLNAFILYKITEDKSVREKRIGP